MSKKNRRKTRFFILEVRRVKDGELLGYYRDGFRLITKNKSEASIYNNPDPLSSVLSVMDDLEYVFKLKPSEKSLFGKKAYEQRMEKFPDLKYTDIFVTEEYLN